MNDQLPIITTPRLLLRAFTMDDCPAVAALCGDPKIAATTLLIPHPYMLGDAENWISTHAQAWRDRRHAQYAITERESGTLIGAVALHMNRDHRRAEIGYWIGVPWWGRGYATEAGRALIDWGFEHLDLNRIFANHFAVNPASGRVLQKLGMTFEGVARQLVFKNGEPIDCPFYAILRSEHTPLPAAATNQAAQSL